MQQFRQIPAPESRITIATSFHVVQILDVYAKAMSKAN